jgi:hypothetical protein
MEEENHGTKQKEIQCQHEQSSGTQPVKYKMSYHGTQKQAQKQLQTSWTKYLGIFLNLAFAVFHGDWRFHGNLFKSYHNQYEECLS